MDRISIRLNPGYPWVEKIGADVEAVSPLAAPAEMGNPKASTRPGGGIGRHDGLRSRCRKA